MVKTYYITTPIYYPNDVPHLGHAYTTIAADILARWHKLLGEKVFFITGTDEHGKKLAETASKVNQEPKEFIDKLIPEFKKDWKTLNIEYDRFIRTTDKDHEKIVQQILQKVYDNGDIYLGEYDGLYCTACEAYYTEKDSVELKCPIHQKQLENIKEKSYFFKLSKYQNFLLEHYKKNNNFILPEKKANEIINRIEEGLKDLSISRTSFDWGIPLPFDKNHIAYVWFDALINYYTATQSEQKLKKFWPAQAHIMGKDILWFHAVYWPAILKSAGLELPITIFAHGWWTVEGKKMGKSAGNAITIDKLVNIAGLDGARYFLLRETPFGEDGDFSEKSLIDRHNNELANKLGNLISRVSTLAEKYGLEKKAGVSILAKETLKQVNKHFENYELHKVIEIIFAYIDQANEYIQNKKPWEVRSPQREAPQQNEEAHSKSESNSKQVLYELVFAIRNATILLSPFMPETAEKIAKTFSFEINLKDIDKPLKISKIVKSDILFKKI